MQSLTKHTCKMFGMEGLVRFKRVLWQQVTGWCGQCECVLTLTLPQYPTLEEDSKQHVTD